MAEANASKRVLVPYVRQIQTGKELIANSAYNKGLAFTDHERTTLCLHGLLPPRVMTLEEQAHQVTSFADDFF